MGGLRNFRACQVSQCGRREVRITKIFIAPSAQADSIRDAGRSSEEVEEGATTVSLDTRLSNRVIDLKSLGNHATFRISDGVCALFKEYLHQHDFVRFCTPTLNATASEGGSNAFKAHYFNNDAYLAQSPQLRKQMLICGDFERVFVMAPEFRADYI